MDKESISVTQKSTIEFKKTMENFTLSTIDTLIKTAVCYAVMSIMLPEKTYSNECSTKTESNIFNSYKEATKLSGYKDLKSKMKSLSTRLNPSGSFLSKVENFVYGGKKMNLKTFNNYQSDINNYYKAINSLYKSANYTFSLAESITKEYNKKHKKKITVAGLYKYCAQEADVSWNNVMYPYNYKRKIKNLENLITHPAKVEKKEKYFKIK